MDGIWVRCRVTVESRLTADARLGSAGATEARRSCHTVLAAAPSETDLVRVRVRVRVRARVGDLG